MDRKLCLFKSSLKPEEPPMTIGERLKKDKEFEKNVKGVENLATIGGNSYDRIVKGNYNEKNGNMDYRYGAAYSLLQKKDLNPSVRQNALEDVKEGYRNGKFSEKDISDLNITEPEKKQDFKQ